MAILVIREVGFYVKMGDGTTYVHKVPMGNSESARTFARVVGSGNDLSYVYRPIAPARQAALIGRRNGDRAFFLS